jgi:stage V sporulation protein R
MTEKPLLNEARGEADPASPQRGKGVPQQQSGHAEAGAEQSGAAAAGAVHTAAARDTPERPSRGKGKSV